VWIGAGALGRNSGRAALYFREDLALLGPPPFKGDAPAGEQHDLVRDRLSAGACFFTDLLVDVTLSPEELQEALWDLVWAGEVTNDAFAPLRAPRLTLARAQRERAAGRGRSGSRFVARGRGPGAAAQVQGRWSLTAPLFPEIDPGTRRRALCELLLERYGILSREQVLADGVPGGFAAMYPSLSELETLGVARRGYFVEGLGGAQFALPGAVERLRASPTRDEEPIVLAAVDPAQPYGGALRWPRPGLTRAAGAYVVLAAGAPILYLERGGRGLQTVVELDDPRIESALGALVAEVRAGRIKRLALEKVDGGPAMGSALAPMLVAHGFQEGPRRLTLSA